MDLAKEYREIAKLTGGELTHLDTHLTSNIDLRTIDGLFQIWDEYCKPKGWDWCRSVTTVYAVKGKQYPNRPYTGNFHADFCRLLVAVLREINSTPERTKGS